MKRQLPKGDFVASKKLGRRLSIVLVLLTVITAMLVPLLSSQRSDIGMQNLGTRYKVGELADEDVFSPSSFQFVDETKTNALIQDALKSVLPHFSYALRPTNESYARIKELTAITAENAEQEFQVLKSKLEEQNRADSGNVLGRISSLNDQQKLMFFDALRQASNRILSDGLYTREDLSRIQQDGYTTFLIDNTVSMKGLDPLREQSVSQAVTKDRMYAVLEDVFKAYLSLDASFQPYLLTDTLALLLEENVHYEEVETLALRTQAAQQIIPQTVSVERGQRIVTKDTVVTKAQLLLLQKIGSHVFHYTLLELIGRSIFILLATSVSIFVFIQFHHTERRLYLYLNLMLFSVLFSLLALFALTSILQSYSIPFLDSFLPVLFAPLFTAHITSKKRLGLVAAFLLACYATLMPQATSMTFFFSLTVSGLSLYFFQYTIKRLEDLFNWFYAGLSTSFAALALNLIVGLPLQSLLPLIGGMLINLTISLVIVEAAVPLCEHIFNIPTAFRLSELAFSDSPVLERLAAVAQGTFNHSRYVSELAYQGAKAIGANAMLARVGGIFHDIGKADHPEYFIENQGSENKHDDIKPSLSAAIIKSHVKLGLEKGREAGLPQEVLDIIAQHHGNDVIQFFYNEAKEQAQSAGVDVKEDDFSYNGNPPTFPESAIVMLADCVEAASRTIKRPNHSKYQKLAHSIIMGKIERGQLNDSQLSLTDLDHIEDAFVQTLIGRDHHRIEYPDEKIENPKSKG
ncbi:MAG: HD family phosphohydrolase [Sphaerochaeta sp.]|uniref:HD family phosphohydrolase n=1 Tax=Sphaerochaeta sp. TaxID=1972642 RepID=UPI003D13B042